MGGRKILKKKSLGINALLNSLQNLLNLIFPLITFPYISRVLSVNSVGKYNFSSSIISYFLLLAAPGISTFAVREGSKFRENRSEFSYFAGKIFSINLISMFVSYVLLFIIISCVPTLHEYRLAILIFSIQIFFTTIGTEWIYIIYEEYSYITLRNIFFKIISIILLFIFVKHSNDYLNYVIITVFASTGSYILNFFHAKKYWDLQVDFKFDIKQYLVPMLTIFMSTIAIQIYVNLDTTMIAFLVGDYSVGIYSVATKIYTMVGFVMIAMLTATIPRLAMLAGQKRFEEYSNLLKELVNSLAVIVLPGIVGLFMVSKDIIILIAGEKYISASFSLKILCFALIGSILSTFFNHCVLIPMKREKGTLISSSTSAILNICLNFILIPILAEKGAAITTAISEFVMAGMNYYFCRDKVGYIFKDRELLKNIVTTVMGCVAIIIVSAVCHFTINGVFLRLLLTVIFSVISYVIILLLLKNIIITTYVKKIVSKII